MNDFRTSDLFDELPDPDPPADDPTVSLFQRPTPAADLVHASRRQRVIELIGLDFIQPDPKQPRRVGPKSLYDFSHKARSDGRELVADWFDMIPENRQGQVQNYMYSVCIESADVDPLDDLDPITARFVSLVNLAASISREGLANPITVYLDQDHFMTDQYIIETGERRWLAFHMLARMSEQGSNAGTWSKIPARIVQGLDPWRQAAENSQRGALNAIGRARQYALLLMELCGGPPQAIAAFHHEQQFYQQALEFRTPYGQGARLRAALNVTSDSSLNRYRRLLNLDSKAWDLADENDLPESEIFRAQKNQARGTVADPPPLPAEIKADRRAFFAGLRRKNQLNAVERAQLAEQGTRLARFILEQIQGLETPESE